MRRQALATAWAISLFASLATGSSHAADLIWEVENPFRFFLDPADTEVHRATWKSLTPEQAVNPILSAENLLSERHPEGWAATRTRPPATAASASRSMCFSTACGQETAAEILGTPSSRVNRIPRDRDDPGARCGVRAAGQKPRRPFRGEPVSSDTR